MQDARCETMTDEHVDDEGGEPGNCRMPESEEPCAHIDMMMIMVRHELVECLGL